MSGILSLQRSGKSAFKLAWHKLICMSGSSKSLHLQAEGATIIQASHIKNISIGQRDIKLAMAILHQWFHMRAWHKIRVVITGLITLKKNSNLCELTVLDNGKKTEEKMLYSLWKCNDRIFCFSIWLIVNPQTGFEIKLTLMTREWVKPTFLFFVKNSKWKIVKIVYRTTHTSLDIWVCQTYARRRKNRKNQVLGRNMGREIKVDRHTVEMNNTS